MVTVSEEVVGSARKVEVSLVANILDGELAEYLIMLNGSTPVGAVYLRITEERARLRSIRVEQPYRGRGIGTLAMAMVLEELRHREVEELVGDVLASKRRKMRSWLKRRFRAAFAPDGIRFLIWLPSENGEGKTEQSH